MRGILVAIEGIDGSGKSTLTQRLANSLRSIAPRIVITREPTDFETGVALRRRLSMERMGGASDAAIDAEYFSADRILHNRIVIQPAIEAGQIVLSDRYELGTLAYQSTQGLPMRYLVEKRDALRALGLVTPPALNLILDVPVELAMERLAARGRQPDKFEEPSFLTALRETYLSLAREPDSRAKVLDATMPETLLHQEAFDLICSLLELDTRPSLAERA